MAEGKKRHEDYDFYAMLGSLDFMVDIREFKKMECYCPNKKCPFSKTPIRRTVQAEVDVAIAIKLAELSLDDEIDDIVLITGDRDFYDALRFAGKRKQLHLFCFEKSHHGKLKEVVKNIMQLDDIWAVIKFQPK